MARRFDAKELVHLLDGPERRPVEYRFGTRRFLGRLRSPGTFETQLSYQQGSTLTAFDALSNRFWLHDNSFPFWRRAGVATNEFWGP